MSTKVTDACAVVDEMANVYDAADDLALIRSTRDNMMEILQICQDKEQSVKHIIRGKLFMM